MIITDLEQQTNSWLLMRAGCCTASRMADVMSKLKRVEAKPKKDNGEPPKILELAERMAPGLMTAKRRDYLFEVAVGRLTGRNPETYVSKEMEWGIANEPFAKAAYEVATDNMVQDVGIAIHPTIKWFAASPDGLVGDDGLIECKCPNSTTHLGYMFANVVPEEYKPQMLAEMACSERKWVDFVSYDPRMEKKLQLFVRRFYRDDAMIAVMELEVVQFLKEVEDLIEAVRNAKATE